MTALDTRFMSISELANLISRRELSPLEITRECLERIATADDQLNSFVTVTADLAVSQASEAEDDLAHGYNRGPLHGVPVALKDLYSTKGVPTTAHSKVLQDWTPSTDATTTSKLREAGTVLLGKLTMHEFAFAMPGFDTPFPPARNPWNPAYLPGGSSSGAGAALAAGFCYGALGSDSGGSIRSPAAHCGIVGMKPTYGRVSRYGVIPLSWSLDHAGPMARTVEDCALLLQVIAGYDSLDPASANVPAGDYTSSLKAGVKGLKVGVARSWLEDSGGCDPEILTAFEAALEVLTDQGAEVIDIEAEPFIKGRAVTSLILTAEAYAYHEETLRTRAHDFGSAVRNRLRTGAFLSAADYIQAQRARTSIVQDVQRILERVDVICSPVSARPAQSFEELDPDALFNQPSFTNAFNATGLPALSVPCGFSSVGLPLGLQIAGRAFEEATVFRVAYAYERSTRWHDLHPSI